MGQGHKYPGAFAQRGNAATGTVNQENFLNAGANPIELLPGAPVTRTPAGHFLQEEVPVELAAAIRDVAARAAGGA